MNVVELAPYLLLASLCILIRNCKNTSRGLSCIGMKNIGLTKFEIILKNHYRVTLSNAAIPASSAICITAKYGSNPTAYNGCIAK